MAEAPKPVVPTKPVVLVADDDDQIRDVAKTALEESLSVQVVEAADGEAALVRIYRDKPALVVIDLLLPVRHGWQVIRDIRAEPTTKELPIIALSATGDRWGALGAGSNEYLNKPFKIDELVAMAKKWLAAATPRP